MQLVSKQLLVNLAAFSSDSLSKLLKVRSICRSINVTPPSTPNGPRRAPRIVEVAADEEGDEENVGRRSKRIAAGGGRRGHPPAKRGRGGRY